MPDDRPTTSPLPFRLPSQGQPINKESPVLIVDDDSDALVILRRLLKKAGIENPVHVANDGVTAIEYLQARLDSADLPRPMLIFLDLKMPRADGFEVLDWVRAQPELRNLFIVVMSSSAQERDMSRAQALGARSYLAKFPVASDLTSIYHVANSMTTVAELDRLMPPLR